MTFCVSIHAPARGATGAFFRICGLFKSFNPRSRAGSDTNQYHIDWVVGIVSIHAPARGATITGLQTI
jgi:hypothetical protein